LQNLSQGVFGRSQAALPPQAEGWAAGPPEAADQKLLKRSEKACRAERTASCETARPERSEGQPQKNRKILLPLPLILDIRL